MFSGVGGDMRRPGERPCDLRLWWHRGFIVNVSPREWSCSRAGGWKSYQTILTCYQRADEQTMGPRSPAGESSRSGEQWTHQWTHLAQNDGQRRQNLDANKAPNFNSAKE